MLSVQQVSSLVVVGYSSCPFFRKAVTEAHLIKHRAKEKGTEIELDITEFETKAEFENMKQGNHTTCPFIWLVGPQDTKTFIGGYDDLKRWTDGNFQTENQNGKSKFLGYGESSDEEMMKRVNVCLDMFAKNPSVLKPEEFLDAHPIAKKILNGEPLSVFPGSSAPNGTLYTLERKRINLHDMLKSSPLFRKYSSAPMLLNFGSFT
uniref:Glutaredoxin domain-containing protein n=1 Tax=Aplanochytrium stocchinoi TaxID=215587 RepID=A0A7S3PER1_9STRA|mmetsp:Transcript_7201/g.8667  ORF Transcript_7201/g.8667 Transcript_7201/m.8667 type:complete len:206 (+) Transcript_7201:183-800(+)